MHQLSQSLRSFIMSRIRGMNTKPELLVRSCVHRMGFRFRLHRRELPGCPDLVFLTERKAIFVHGCFWHLHRCIRKRGLPKSNVRFWHDKLWGNVRRDKRNLNALRRSGWKVLCIWECELRNLSVVSRKLRLFLEGRRAGKARSRKAPARSPRRAKC
jgi:DNA mismatch endonuclease (patch repair protein)